MRAVNTMNIKVYGGIVRERVNHELPVLLNSRVSLAEGVQVWMDSLRECGRLARLARELDAWQGKKRGG